MVKPHCYLYLGVMAGSVAHGSQHFPASILDISMVGLHDHRHIFFIGSGDDTLHGFHIEGIKTADSKPMFLGIVK